jgi:hypothetical protein
LKRVRSTGGGGNSREPAPGDRGLARGPALGTGRAEWQRFHVRHAYGVVQHRGPFIEVGGLGVEKLAEAQPFLMPFMHGGLEALRRGRVGEQPVEIRIDRELVIDEILHLLHGGHPAKKLDGNFLGRIIGFG